MCSSWHSRTAVEPIVQACHICSTCCSGGRLLAGAFQSCYKALKIWRKTWGVLFGLSSGAGAGGEAEGDRRPLDPMFLTSRINEKSVWCCGWLPCTPLRIAATAGHGPCVDFLLQKGAEIDLVDVKGQTALYVAVVNGHLECAKILLEAGADPNGSRHHRSTPVYHAARVGRADILQELIRWEMCPGDDPDGVGEWLCLAFLLPLDLSIMWLGVSIPSSPTCLAKLNKRTADMRSSWKGVRCLSLCLGMVTDPVFVSTIHYSALQTVFPSASVLTAWFLLLPSGQLLTPVAHGMDHPPNQKASLLSSAALNTFCPWKQRQHSLFLAARHMPISRALSMHYTSREWAQGPAEGCVSLSFLPLACHDTSCLLNWKLFVQGTMLSNYMSLWCQIIVDYRGENTGCRKE